MNRRSALNDRQQPADDFLVGDSEIVQFVRGKDWSQTPLGPIERWPQSLRTTVSLCMASNFPINIIWGSDHSQVYNAGYRICCGDAHPTAMGQSYRVTWASAWPVIGEPFERALLGESVFLENQRMFLTRNGYLEETFFTFTISPIRDESGAIGGLFHPVTETTSTILADRRTRALRDLTASLSTASSMSELTRFAVDTLSRSAFDVPFLLAFERSGDGKAYACVGQQGFDAAGFAGAAGIQAISSWPVDEALRRQGMVLVSDLRPVLDGIHCGPYPESPAQAMVIPVGTLHGDRSVLILVAGVSPRLPLNDAYRGFYELLLASLSAAMATVRAREHERHRADALAEIDRAKTAFFSNVSHEFRTPLTLMLGPLEEAMAAGEDLTVAMREHVSLAHRNGQRLLKLVNTLLEFSRIEAGRLEATYEPTDIGVLTADLASNFRAATERAGLSLLIHVEPLPRLVNVDREMWEKVVLNLLSNAFKFTFAGAITVSIRPSADERSVEISVKDTGIGIAAEEIPRLFERFHRVEGARGRSIEGSGIGLALVQELVRLQGGTLGVESTPGKGSDFTVTLPLGWEPTSASSTRVPPSLDAAPGSSHAVSVVNEVMNWLPAEDGASANESPREVVGHVLLADDNLDMRGYMRRLLTAQGFTVEAVVNGEAALAAARRQLPDLIISDVMMPVIDGFELLTRLRADAELKDVPVILLSARAGDEARVEGLSAGADDYLTKPFSRAELVARVTSTLNRTRARREAALRASEARLREINADLERQVALRSVARGRTLELSPDLIGVLTADGYFENSNPAWKTLLGWSEAEVGRTAFLQFIHPDDVATSQATFDDAIRLGHPALRFENRCRTRTGDYRWLSWVAVPEGGKVYCSARDVTADKSRAAALAQTQESLRQSQKMEAIGQLTGGLAHDFNNLLTGITGSLEMLHSRVTQGRVGEVERYVNAAQGAARRAAALTHRLLAFSRRQTLDPKSIDMDLLVRGMGELIQRTIGPEISLEVVSSAGLWRTLVDPGQLENALLNLCINSRDAMPLGGKLTIETANRWLDERAARDRDVPPGQYVSLCVSDTGTGMSPAVKTKAFDPFFTTKPIGMGTGLGLSMIYGFARQSGGEVRIYSEIDKGTLACLYLPRHLGQNETCEPLQDLTERARAGHHETVLVVDDEPTVRMLVVDVLQDAGYTAIDAPDGIAGLRILNSPVRIDLLVSDVGLPGGMNGRQLADAARVARPNLKVLFITGYAENAVLNHGHLDSGMHVLTKPFTMEALARRIKELVGGD